MVSGLFRRLPCADAMGFAADGSGNLSCANRANPGADRSAFLDCDRADDVFGVSDDDGVEDESAEEGDVGGLLRLFGNDCGPDPDL